MAKEVLIKNTKHFHRAKEGTDNYDPIYEHNVFSSNGEEWKRYKTLLSPGFSEKNLEYIFENHIHESTNELCFLWKENLMKGNHLFNVSNYMKELALDVIGSAGFGIKLNAVKNNDMKIMNWTRKWVQALQFTALIPPSIQYYTLLGFFNVMNEFYKVSKQFKTLLNGIIDKRKTELSNSDEEKYDLLSRMITAKNEDLNALKDHELMGNAHVLLVAGHEVCLIFLIPDNCKFTSVVFLFSC
jgi:cytochrome P450